MGAALAVRRPGWPAMEPQLGIALMQKQELPPVPQPSLRAVFEGFAPGLAA